MRTRNYTLTAESLAELECVIREDKRASVVKRATAVRMLHMGEKPEVVAERFLVSRGTVRNWHTRWLAEGVAGLVDKPKSGRPPLATEAYVQVLDEALASEPSHYGYTFTIWTLKRLRDHAEKLTGIHLHEVYLSEVLRQHGYVYRRPKHDLRPHQDAEGRRRAAEMIEELKKVQKQRQKTNSLPFSLWTRQR